jgi:hypothetical protein
VPRAWPAWPPRRFERPAQIAAPAYRAATQEKLAASSIESAEDLALAIGDEVLLVVKAIHVLPVKE